MKRRYTLFGSLSGSVSSMLLLLTAGLAGTVCTEPAAHGQPDGPSTARQPAGRSSEMLLRVNSINVYAIGDNARVPLERVKDPLLRFADAVDHNENGAIWLWGRTGRPGVIVQMWRDPTNKRWQFYSFTSLSTGLVTAQGTGLLRSLRWTPNKPGLEFRQLPSAASPAAKAPARLRQMKELAREFKAHEILDDQRFELRRLARQVHRYADPKSGLIDGAAFIWSRGSDPEIILLIELVKTATTTTKWQYGLARISSAELRVERNGQQVWRKPSTNGTRADPYFLHGEDLLYSGSSR